jgi:SAM-dependent methyltransferase
MKSTIMYEATAHGGRLKYFHQTADSDYWDRLWQGKIDTETYHRERAGHLPNQLRQTFLRWVKPPARVLEAGCGLGRFTVAAHARGYRAEGVDWAPETIATLQKCFPNIPFSVGDVRYLSDIGNECFDAVFSPGVCEHFEGGPEPVLRETNRILKYRGIAIISTPCLNGFRRILYQFGAFRKQPHGQFYQYAFSPAELQYILETLGFRVIQILQYGTLRTLADHVPLIDKLSFGPIWKPLNFALTHTPYLRKWGHSCIWVAQKQ